MRCKILHLHHIYLNLLKQSLQIKYMYIWYLLTVQLDTSSNISFCLPRSRSYSNVTVRILAAQVTASLVMGECMIVNVDEPGPGRGLWSCGAIGHKYVDE